MLGITDVIFAVDSIPAIFAITTDPFIVLTSNVFAVLGLRAMFFLLQGMADRFHLLPYGLALVLVFIGMKMLLIDVLQAPDPAVAGHGGGDHRQHHRAEPAAAGETARFLRPGRARRGQPRPGCNRTTAPHLGGMSTITDHQHQSDRGRVRRALNASLAGALLLWLCFAAQQGFDWRFLAVVPQSAAGLRAC